LEENVGLLKQKQEGVAYAEIHHAANIDILNRGIKYIEHDFRPEFDVLMLKKGADRALECLNAVDGILEDMKKTSLEK
jgi:hypothetical protein